MKLSVFCPLRLKTPIYAAKIGVLGVFHPQNMEQYQRNPHKGTSADRNGSRGVLIVSLSSTVPEKLRGKRCDEEEEEEELRHILAVLASLKNGRDMIVCNFFDIYMFILSRTQR